MGFAQLETWRRQNGQNSSQIREMQVGLLVSNISFFLGFICCNVQHVSHGSAKPSVKVEPGVPQGMTGHCAIPGTHGKGQRVREVRQKGKLRERDTKDVVTEDARRKEIDRVMLWKLLHGGRRRSATTHFLSPTV